MQVHTRVSNYDVETEALWPLTGLKQNLFIRSDFKEELGPLL